MTDSCDRTPSSSAQNSAAGRPPPDSRARIESIYRAAPIGIGLVKDRIFLEVNDCLCRMTGYSPNELVGNSSRMLYVSDEEFDYVGKEKYRQIQDQGTGSVKTRFRTKTGNMLDIILSSTPIDPDDLSLGVTFTAVDITRDIQMEAQLHQARKMEAIGVLAGGIAHDFNNILFPIMGHAELLLEDIPADSPFRNNLEKIHAASLRARDLVKQILTFSRQEKQRPRVLILPPVIRDVMKMVRSTLPASIRIIEKIDSDCGPVRADPIQIHQAVMNLATNAYHAMEENGGKLTVSLNRFDDLPPDLTSKNPKIREKHSGPWICLRVSDTGTGMDPLTANKIFDPFFTTKNPGRGTGMGLAVVHGTVMEMNGAIQVHSELGRGTTVNLYFPSVSELQADLPEKVKDRMPGGTERILLVDDETEIVSMEKEMLASLGYVVAGFSSSAEALEQFQLAPDSFDLVITDMAMPGMTGDKLARKLRKIRPGIPLLICTGFSRIMDRDKAASLGFNGFLYKPVVMKDLAFTIRRILDT